MNKTIKKIIDFLMLTLVVIGLTMFLLMVRWALDKDATLPTTNIQIPQDSLIKKQILNFTDGGVFHTGDGRTQIFLREERAIIQVDTIRYDQSVIDEWVNNNQ